MSHKDDIAGGLKEVCSVFSEHVDLVSRTERDRRAALRVLEKKDVPCMHKVPGGEMLCHGIMHPDPSRKVFF